MEKSEIINCLIKKYGFKRYLEIGLDNPEHNFTKINCEVKHSVDPFFEEDHKDGFDIRSYEFKDALKYLTYRMTSDEYFETHSDKYDIILVDGLHREFQAGRDIINGLKCPNKGGFIVVHDCLPMDEASQVVPRIQPLWNGDVWKCIPMLSEQGIEFEVVDTDFGCGIIKYKENPEELHYMEKSPYRWRDFATRRNELMHVITIGQFFEKYLM